MRALEWALVMTQLAAAAGLAWPAQRDARLRLGWAALLAGLLVLQPVLEGYRWQLWGLYAGSVLLAGSQLLRGRRLLAGSSLALLALLSAAPPLLFPVPQLMPPTGRYAVGVTSFAVTDPVRKEIYSNNALDARAVLVQVWYPAVPAPGAQRGPWLENVEQLAPMISRAIKMPDFLLDHLKYGTANSYPNAPIISTPALLPVVHFSHGWDSFRTQSTFLMEELASHGYVVVSTEHPYGAVGTIMPDGRVLQHNRAILPRGAPADVYHAAAMRQAGQWVGDTQLVLGYLRALPQTEPANQLAGRLALDRVGITGHSNGGGAALEFCSRSPQCGAYLGFDPWINPVSEQARSAGLAQPALFLFSDRQSLTGWNPQENQEQFAQVRPNLRGRTLLLTMRNSGHYDFSDLPMLSPLAPLLGLKGSIDGERALTIVREMSVAFFDEYLRGQPQLLLQNPTAAFPELVNSSG